ncbi:hypothetical protein [Halalkalibacter okhensis]|uniref:hypothetical protein n=1 Tax=Halalkalibacter okhensis TaxID=333138 RepID=UPI00068D567F|nr:hypothetical protein [Halalkalibacter okhensis]
MTSNIVIEFEEMIDIDFTQASIYMDACFILAYLDSKDARGDKVANIMEKWDKDGIDCVAISNLVMSEVVHNLFKNEIRNVLALTHKILKREKGRSFTPTAEELDVLNDFETAKRLTSLIPKSKLDDLIRTGQLHYSIEELLKQYKIRFPLDRDPLHHYYNKSVDSYNAFVEGIGFKVLTPDSGFSTQLAASSYIKLFQLSPYDAFHLALAAENHFDYLATLDSDFVHNYYTKENIGFFKVLKVA